MKSGDAVLLHLAATLPDPAYDVTYVLYDNEEVEADKNGLNRLVATRRDLLDADLAVLMEPTNGAVEAGCQGTLRVQVAIPGRRAHSARGWLGENAIHAAAPLLTTLVRYDAREVDIDGCTYREGLNAVKIEGGVAGNVVPDACTRARELPLRARPHARSRPTSTCARCWRRTPSCSPTARRARCPGCRRPPRALRRGGRRHPRREVRLDRRRPLRRARHPRGELRAGRPEPRAHARGVGRGRADHGGRARAAGYLS